MDAGGRAMPGAIADDCMDAGSRAMPGAIAGKISIYLLRCWSHNLTGYAAVRVIHKESSMIRLL
jgi:hypothetical protein